MKIMTQAVLARASSLGLLLTLLLAGPGLSQSPTPLADLNIVLWPEYDQPQVLVIFQGRVADGVPLPAPVSFTLPASVETLHAVAYVDQELGSLVNIPEYDLVEGADGNVLSFSTPSQHFQFEYYSDALLSTSGNVREISFSFTSSTDVTNLSLELQQPTSAQAFTSTPSPSATEVRQDGLAYALYRPGTLSAGDSYSLQASYTRSTDELSVNSLGVSVPTSTEQTAVEVGGGGLRDKLGLILFAAGVLLLVGALGTWYWSQRGVVVPEPAPRPRRRTPSRKKPRTVPKSARPPATGKTLADYCHRCGTKFREDARFCHACGAESRTD